MSAPKPALGFRSRSAAVRALRADGLPSREIADRLGIELKTISALDPHASGRPANPYGRSLTDEQLDEMAELRERGWSASKIQRHFALKGVTVSHGLIHWQCLRIGADLPPERRHRCAQRETPYVRNGREVRPFTADEDRRLLELEAKGIAVTRIARQLGRQNNSVKGRLMILARRQARAEEAVL